MGQIGGDKVYVSLDLVHHSICVGHVAPVLHAGAPVSANHTLNLFLDFSCKTQVRLMEKEENAYHICIPIQEYVKQYEGVPMSYKYQLYAQKYT